MDNTELQNEEHWKRWEKSSRRAKIFGGMLLVTAGILFIAREAGTELPHWLFSWKMILIAIGLVHGVKHNFRRPGWLIMVAIGGAFLVSDLVPGLNLRPYLIPALLILIGLFFIFRPNRRRHHYGHCRDRWKHHAERYGYHGSTATGGPSGSAGASGDDDYLESTAIFGGVKKTVLSKKFRGGEVTIIFGGSEINLSQADFEDGISIEVTQVFGGTKLIIPANWEIKSDLVTILGGIEDKRPVPPTGNTGPAKRLTINGTIIFGGIEIKSY